MVLFTAALVVGVVLVSCSGSAGSANNGTKASPTGSAAPSPVPTSPAVAKPNPAAAQNAPANASPKQQRFAEAKKVIPAAPVVAGAKGPRIAFANEEIDFGNLEFEDIVRVAFQFKNVGDEPLKITKASVEVVEGC